jgi:diguanylate cyclase (GGDEF)-like protein
MDNSLRIKIAVLASILVMATVLSLTYISIQREKTNFMRELENQASLLLNTLPLTMRDYLLQNQVNELIEVGQIIQTTENITQFAIYDADGNVLVDVGSSNLDMRVPIDSFGRQIVNISVNGIYLYWQQNQLIAGRPVKVNDRTIGGFLVGLSTEQLNQKIATITQEGVLLAIIASIIGAGLSYLLGVQMSRPLTKLADIASQMADGNLNIRSSLKYNDEIGQLGSTFNYMAAAIQKREDDLRDLATNLEKSVKERTLELQQKNEVLEEIAITDELTKIFNRRHFFDLAENEIERAKRYNHPVSIILVDADHFKNINDSYGHLVGDQILINLANFLQENIRRIDILARYGGEEFIILMPETECKNAENSAERIRKLVETSPMTKGGIDVKITISIGIACWDGKGNMALDSLLAHADYALYQSKEYGRNRVSVWESRQ